MRFWDSSAVVPLLVEEPETKNMETLLKEDGEMIAWWTTRTKCIGALARKRREGNLTPGEEGTATIDLEALSERWTEIRPVEPVRLLAERALRVHEGLRAADSLQLWADGSVQGQAFVTLDEDLALAAAREGFLVFP